MKAHHICFAIAIALAVYAFAPIAFSDQGSIMHPQLAAAVACGWFSLAGLVAMVNQPPRNGDRHE